MNTAGIRENPSALTERQRGALISLLADEDPFVYQDIRETLISYGSQALDWLKPYTRDCDPMLRRRACEISLHLGRQNADTQFLAFCLSRGEDLDLEYGTWLLAQTQYPEINVSAYQAILDGYVIELRERLTGCYGPEKILAITNQYLFAELGYAGNEQDYYEPENSYFNRVIDRRLGNPISMCLLYLLVGRRLRFPLVGIGMPGHFVCRFQTPSAELFVDAFNRGKILTKADCIKYLLQSGHGYLEGYLAPVSPRRMLLRMCANLHQIYVDMEQSDQTSRLQRYIVALSK
jgi:regulator of sirC expression with transglutaminase-like and TPR domain